MLWNGQPTNMFWYPKRCWKVENLEKLAVENRKIKLTSEKMDAAMENELFFRKKKTEMNRINVLSGMLCAVDALKSTWGNMSKWIWESFVIILFSNTSKYRWEIWGYPQNPVKKSWNMMIPHDLELSYVQTHPYHLVISHSHGKSLINGGINGENHL